MKLSSVAADASTPPRQLHKSCDGSRTHGGYHYIDAVDAMVVAQLHQDWTGESVGACYCQDRKPGDGCGGHTEGEDSHRAIVRWADLGTRLLTPRRGPAFPLQALRQWREYHLNGWLQSMGSPIAPGGFSITGIGVPTGAADNECFGGI